MDNPVIPAVLGAMVMALIFVMLIKVGAISVTEHNQAIAAIRVCESTLPRDKTCKYVITAEVAE